MTEDWSDDEDFEKVIETEVKSCLTSSAAPTVTDVIKKVDVTTSFTAPEEFQFPFQPYDIQVQLMRKIYEALELGKIGIFESPTGTGKSMSMICGALKWLVEHEKKEEMKLQELLSTINKEEREKQRSKTDTKPEVKVRASTTKSLPDWVLNHSNKREEKEEVEKVRREREAILKREQKLLELKQNLQAPATSRHHHKRKRDTDNDTFSELLSGADDDLREGYQKEAETIDDDFLLNQLETQERSGDVDQSDNDAEEDVYVTKIYFCSRTHSQLSQFVGEVKKSPYSDIIRCVSLGSRQNMCINPAVNSLKSLSLINDRCKELQKNSKKKVMTSNPDTGSSKKRRGTSCACPYYNQTRIRHLTDRALTQVKDIEDLVTAGKKVKACPYYAARHAIPAAQLVVLPYNTLLHNSTRQATGIKLEGNIVVIDEAHNLLETISNIHSVEVHLSQFSQCRSQLIQYRDKYKSRLLAINLLHVNQLIDVIGQIIEELSKPHKQGSETSWLMTVNDFLSHTELDNINFFTLLRFCERSMIARKLSGFVEKLHSDSQLAKHAEVKGQDTKPVSGLSGLIDKIKQQNEKTTPQSTPDVEPEDPQTGGREKTVAHMNSPLYLIESLLQSLTNSDSDGRVIINKPTDKTTQPSIRYLLLNPAIYFSKIVRECRAVVIAGGTMQPVSEFKEQLLQMTGHNVTPERILEFSCGHVINDKNLLPIALSHDGDGRKLDFTYQSRNLPATLESLSCVLLEVSKCVPGGVVCFLPSYQYEGVVMNYLNKSGHYQAISAHKKIFREPKKANMVETVLDAYCKSIKTTGGAFLFSVVGGKMSEGINFSDDLGRCVVMVGLPYPNMYSPELKEKMKYLNANMTAGAGDVLPGQVHYENLCMKAVNQSIGRAIRHRNDYASMMLVDHRYQKDSIIRKLPGWLRDHVTRVTSLPQAVSNIKQFFYSHQ